LKDIYYAEKKITKALPKMAKAASSSELATAFKNHLAETQGHVDRLEQVFDLLGTLNAGGLAVLLAEQDVRASLALAQQAYVVENGTVALRGPAHALREDSRIKQAYLGL